ncbi:hypothetical protein LPB67_01245 [Undibacterium sp. Jales W-56]|uniref:DUF6776 family protein n=1 Tax=Undibacterium sp. Jales W-56 TaxID=2897325 RepID=UPI0021D2D887|nr:DUF6776 family protein [Undibacterium sp. Jales W-56]MCU6432400.1 hypothetical protein [Undibacterium sp. Jales W-56]
MGRRLGQRRLVASKMTIRQDQPWPVKLAIVAVIIGLAGAVALWTYDLGRNFAFGPKIKPEEVEALHKQLDELKIERDKLAAQVNTSDSQQNIEKSTQKQLADQVKNLTSENLKLKDDLAFFESLMPSATGPEGITLQRVKAEMVAPNQMRYRVLVMQGGKGGRDFAGDLQLSLTLAQGGKPVMMQFPDPRTGEAGKLKLSFRYYQRLEGVITLPEGATVKSLQAKVMDKGQLRAQQSINL